MILTRSPLRITFGGGGTDLPSYSREREGFVVAAAIDKYVYVSVLRPFSPGIYLKYSALENVASIEEVQHPILREALRLEAEYSPGVPQIEITTLADIPAGTGLGSSASFTTALIKALHAHRRKVTHAKELAELACHLEIERLGEPVGRQDAFIAAHGGIACMTFHHDDRVTVEPLAISAQTRIELEDRLLLFFTGVRRAASEVLRDQHERSRAHERAMLENLDEVKSLGMLARRALEADDMDAFARLLTAQWSCKRARSPGMSNPRIDEWYSLGMRNGAAGGKLVGAGGGGFLLFYAADPVRLRRALSQEGLEEVRFRFDFNGSHVLSI